MMPEGKGDDVPFKDYVDSQLAEVRRAAELAMTSRTAEGVDLKDYVEAIWDEQRRGMGVAEEEREKSAKALRAELARSIDEGDRNLREHIEQQVHQIRAALVAADLLEQERIKVVVATLETRFEAAQQAIKKSEDRYDDKFAEANEWRAQSADRERSQAEALALFTSEFIRIDVHKAEMAQLQRQVNELANKVNKNL